jgi:fido (protein-threonine AMPylation protein)
MVDPHASLYRRTVHSSMQFLDMQAAYLYAQEIIIPELYSNPKAITIEQLLKWNRELHQRIAVTLAKDQDFTAGNYSERILTRWHQGREFGQAVELYLMRQINHNSLAREAQKCGAPEKTYKAFVGILDRSRFKSITDLAKAISEGRFSDEEMQQAIAPIVKIAAKPSDIPAKMKDYFANFKKIIMTKPKNISEAAEMAFQVLNGYVQVHPFDGANGRLATLWMNTALVACRFPSILLRFPKERLDKNSAYARAMNSIDSNPELLKKHIQQRIEKPDFNDRVLEKTVLHKYFALRRG